VVNICTDEAATRVAYISCIGPSGPFNVRAKEYVLAGGGLENARLLLTTRARNPKFLRAEASWIGRGFMEHPHYASGILVLDDGRTVFHDRARWDVVYSAGRASQRMYMLDDKTLNDHGLPNAGFFVVPRPASKPVLFAPGGRIDPMTTSAVHDVRMAVLEERWDRKAAVQLLRAARAAPRLTAAALQQAAALRAARRGRANGSPVVFTLVAMTEQLPYDESRVRLTNGLDDFGVPRAALEWHVSEIDRAAIQRRHDLAAPALEHLFGGRVLSFIDALGVPHLGEGYHHMGTTRMSLSPTTGVVDADCRVHTMPNLSIAGSSIFPTSGFSNPTLTLVALAHRLAYRLVRELQPRSVTPGPSQAQRSESESTASP
jgi:choline dehydrogenase-like flavoprotein